MADPTASEMISTLKTTLKALYAKTTKSMSLEERETVMADIDKLENSLRMWERRAAQAANATTNGIGLCKVTLKAAN